MRAAFLSKETEGQIAKKRSRKEKAGKIVRYETFQQKSLRLSFEDGQRRGFAEHMEFHKQGPQLKSPCSQVYLNQFNFLLEN